MQGASLVPIFKGKTPKDWRTTFYYHYYEFPGAHSVARHYGVTDGKHKLIHFYNLKEWELFDLKRDPKEMHSRYGDPQYASVIEEMKKELTRLRDVYAVPEDTRPLTRPKKPKKPKKGKKGKPDQKTDKK